MGRSLAHQTVTVVNTAAGNLIENKCLFCNKYSERKQPCHSTEQPFHSSNSFDVTAYFLSWKCSGLHCSSDNAYHSLPLNECYVKQRNQSEVQTG